MSQLKEPREIATKDEIIEWVKKRIEELEAELKVMKGIISMIEDRGRISVSEKVEEIKMGRRRIARLYRGEDYIRLVPDFPMPLPQEVRKYLENVEEEINAIQEKQGDLPRDDRARLVIEEKPDNSIAEIKFINLYNTIELLKAKAALKYAAELSYQVYKLAEKGED